MILVIDIDKKNGRDGEETLCNREAELGPLPDTLTVKTRNGWHLYFNHPGLLISNSAGRIGDGIDVRSNNGYVVAPPSIVDGHRYEISSDIPLADLPDSWIAYITSEALSSSIDIDEGTRGDSLFRHPYHRGCLS